jgi:selenocysteine lyase/cysteine desulfurase
MGVNVKNNGHEEEVVTDITEQEIQKWRLEFPILQKTIHVANCSQSPQSKRVKEAIETYLSNWSSVGMDWDYWMGETVRAKEEFAKLINASPDEIAISTSVSAAVASIASSLDPWDRRKKIVTTEAEFPTVAYVWLAHQKYGFRVDFVPLRNGRLDLDDYEKIIDEDTVITSVTHVYYQNGFKQDLGKIAKIVHQKGSLFMVDAYQSLGSCDVDVKKLNIDVLVTGNLKFLLGMPGIAFIYVKKELVDKMKPAVTGWFGQENPFEFNCRRLSFAKDGGRFDTGTPAIINAFAARAGMQIINEVGTKRIEERIEKLSEYSIEKAKELGLEYVGPSNILEKGSITAIRVPEPHEVEEILKTKSIVATARGDVIRIAPHFFTTLDDLEKVFDELKMVLEH